MKAVSYTHPQKIGHWMNVIGTNTLSNFLDSLASLKPNNSIKMICKTEIERGIVPYESSSLIQVMQRDTVALQDLYDQNLRNRNFSGFF